MIGLAEVGFNRSYDASHFDIHKTIAYRIITVSCKQSWLETAQDRADKTKTNSTGGTFHSDHIKTGGIFTANPLCITSRNCFWYVSVHQNCPKPSPNHVENVENIEILSFLKTFYNRHCAPYKWNFSVCGIG